METQQQGIDTGGVRPAAIAAGMIVLAVGIAMFLDTTGAVDIRVGRLIGPLVMITIGTAMLLDRSPLVFGCRRRALNDGRHLHIRRGGASSGIWLIGVGCWLLVAQNHVFGLNFHNSWPLFIVLSGIVTVIRGLK
jgi:hypothetical protein